MKHPAPINCHPEKHTDAEKSGVEKLAAAFASSCLPIERRLQSFPRHVRRQDVARFLVKFELFQQILSVHGSIVECGVFAGAGLIGWQHFSAICEPYNHTRKILGFDTFSGFPDVDEKDLKGTSGHLHSGALSTSIGIQREIEHLVSLHDQNRPLGHIPKIELIAGDACDTIPKYVADNAHLLVSLLYLDFDIYAPTKVALQHLYPLVPKGGLVVFDELNCPEFPGETTALLEFLDLRSVELQRIPWDPYISYFIK